MPGDIVLEISGGTEGRPTGRTILIEKDFLDSYSIPVIPASFCRLLRCEGINCTYLYYWLQDMYAKGTQEAKAGEFLSSRPAWSTK